MCATTYEELVEGFMTGGIRAKATALLDKSHRANTIPPVKCDLCKSVSAPMRCLCGEPYCSRVCFENDWAFHKRTCLEVRGFNELGIVMTQWYWAEKISSDFSALQVCMCTLLLVHNRSKKWYEFFYIQGQGGLDLFEVPEIGDEAAAERLMKELSARLGKHTKEGNKVDMGHCNFVFVLPLSAARAFELKPSLAAAYLKSQDEFGESYNYLTGLSKSVLGEREERGGRKPGVGRAQSGEGEGGGGSAGAAATSTRGSGAEECHPEESEVPVHPPPSSPPCDACGSMPSGRPHSLCSKCKSKRYCSTVCQTRGWKEMGHKDECKVLAAMVAARTR